MGQIGEKNIKEFKEYSPKLDLDKAEGLQSYFSGRYNLQNLEKLSGGYTSSVFRGELEGTKVIIKHTRPRDIFYPVRKTAIESRARTEVDVLNRLAPLLKEQEVPKVIDYFPKDDLIIMTDVGKDSLLGLPYLMAGKADAKHARAFGAFVARLKQVTTDWKPFDTVEQPMEQIWTRGLEVDLASPEWGERLRNYYLSSQKFLWVDGHPKNTFFGEKEPLVRAIDWDCSHFADQDYMLPNFFGQLPVFAAMGHITSEQAVNFTKEMILAYNAVSPISPDVERKMVFYAGAQIIQRQDGKWLFDVCGGNDERSLRNKAFIFYFGRKVASSIETFDQYLQTFQSDFSSWIKS